MAEYEIQPSTQRCAGSGRELKPGEECYSVLSESSDGYVRLDFSTEAWQGPPQGAIGFWRRRVELPSGRAEREPVDGQVVMHFFERLAGRDDEKSLSFRYILALLLLRKKLLRFTDSAREGELEVLLLRSVGSGEEHRVVRPRLAEEELVSAEAEVVKMLQNPPG